MPMAACPTHGNITSVFEFGEVDGEYFLAMEFIHGQNLDAVLHRCRQTLAPMPIPAALFVAGEIAHLLLIAAGLWFAPVAATITMVLPYALTRFFLMAGNWAQHAFVNEAAIDDGVRNATILVNASHNHRCFNDGYHALHHQHPGLHWGDMSARFQQDWRSYADRGVLVFTGVPNNQVVWWHLMRKDYAFLARHLVDLGGAPSSQEQRVALLRQRVRFQPG